MVSSNGRPSLPDLQHLGTHVTKPMKKRQASRVHRTGNSVTFSASHACRMQPETTLERPICVPQPVLPRRDRPPGYAEQGRRRQKGRRAATPATGRRIHAQKPSREAV